MREFCFAVIALAAVAIASGEEMAMASKNISSHIVAAQCPVYEDVNQIVFIPHELDCTMYYVCKAGRKVAMYCAYLDQTTGERLHFNPTTEQCDWPGSFICGGSQPPIANECVGNYKSSHESNCGYYYECVSGRKSLRACGGGLHFNPFAQMCQTPAEAGCAGAQPTPRPPTPPPVANECVGSFKTHHESNCGYYYECVNGKKTLRACGGGLHFNPFSQICQTPAEAGCTGAQPTPRPPTPPPVAHECIGSYKSPHESNCGYYYECTNGKKVLKACGGGLHFNPFSQICQTPSQAGCSGSNPAPPPTLRPTPPPVVGKECEGNFKSQHETNCGYYYECVNGKKSLKACGGGLHFNPFAQICQTPAEAGCSGSNPAPPPTPRPTLRPTLPPVANECVGSFKNHHESNCGYYYECVNGKKTLRACGGGLHFNPFSQICEAPSQAGCNTAQPTPRPTVRPTPPPVAGQECVGSFKSRHELNCGFYFECVNGKKVLKSCGGGLHFNPFAQTCQTPAEAGCDKLAQGPKPASRDIECSGTYSAAHESQCTFYYECASGKVALRSCSAGMHFNAFAQTCQPASEAGCHGIFNALLRIFRGPHNFPQKVDA